MACVQSSLSNSGWMKHHISYPASYSIWMALLLVLAVPACCTAMAMTRPLGRGVGLLLGCAAALVLAVGVGAWTENPLLESLILGALIATCVQVGCFTVGVLEHDLGVRDDDLVPGRGRVLGSLKAYLFTAPIVYHFLRWSLDLGE